MRHSPEKPAKTIEAVRRHNSPGYWINDLEALNWVYLAAKGFLFRPDAFTKGRLALAIKEAENG